MRAPLDPLPETHPEAARLFDRPAWLWWLLLAGLFVVGLALRLYRLADPPVDFHPTRQLHSALIARGMYLENNSSAPEWQRDMAVSQWNMEGLIEPQLFERLAAGTYRFTGGPDLRVPRLYAILFWLAAAAFTILLAQRMIGRGGALVTGLFLLVWPYAVTASRAFQPEPLMMALLAAGLWCALIWRQRAEQPGNRWGWAVAAGLLSGLSIYIKSVAVFFLAPALAVIVLSGCAASHGLGSRSGWWRVLRDPQVWVMGALAVLPYAVYHVDGVYLRGYLVGQFSLRFFPEMWLDPAFYLRWISNLERVIPFELVLAALLGSFLVRSSWQRGLLLAMWLGYFAYGMALPHHISTHDYYHLPLLPLLALGLGAAAEALFNGLPGPRRWARLAALGVLLAALVNSGYEARTALKRSGAVEEAQAWEAIGQALGPGASVMALVDDYGTGLKYYAWINPALWPTAADIQWRETIGQGFDFAEFFDGQVASKDYFVITLFAELDRQPALREQLSARYPVFRQGANYIIYDLRSPDSGAPASGTPASGSPASGATTP